MAKFRSIKNSLLGGQISPSAEGRTDLPQYASACKLLKNMIPFPEGGAYRRPGTLFAQAFDASQFSYPRLIPFIVSQSEVYMIALCQDLMAPTSTAGVVKVYRPIGTTDRPLECTVTGNHPYIYDTTTNYHELDSIQWVQSVDVLTIVHPNHAPIRIQRTDVETFQVVTLPTTGANSHIDWPFRRQNITAITLTPAATSGTTTITASANFFNSGHVGSPIKINHAGTIGAAFITAYTSPTQVTVSVINNFGATTASGSWTESAWSKYRGWPRSVAMYQQRVAYGGNTTDRDSIWFSQSDNFDVLSQTFIFDHTVNPPAATSAELTDPLSQGIGSDPFTLVISSQQLNLIQWMSPDKTLAVGTQGDEYIIQNAAGTAYFGCDTATVTPQSHFGSTHLTPMRVGSELLFATQSNQIRTLIFSVLEDTYTSEPVQVLFGNYPKPELVSRRKRFRSFTWDESRQSLWCIDTAGNLFGMTRDRSLQIMTWHTHELGGFDATEIESTDQEFPYQQLCSGSVISVAVAPNPSIGLNDVWLTVRRKIGDSYQYHVERFIGAHIASDTVSSPWLANSGNYFLDSCVWHGNHALTGSGDAETFTVTGQPEVGTIPTEFHDFDHLFGKSVVGTAEKVFGRGIFRVRDSSVQGDPAGSGTYIPLVLPYPVDYETDSYVVIFGLSYQSVVAPVRLEAGSQIGTAQGAIKRIHLLTMRFYKTLSGKFGSDLDQLQTLVFRTGDTPMSESPELYTGDKTEYFDGDYDRDGYLYVVQDDPLPFAVTSIIAEGMTDD